MRPIDADQLLDFIRFDERVIAPEEHTAQDIVMMIKTAPTITPPSNDPLTLEQLREMEGEPVWVEHCNGGEWVIVEWNIHDEIASAQQARLDADNYDSDCLGWWLAYCRKPERTDDYA